LANIGTVDLQLTLVCACITQCGSTGIRADFSRPRQVAYYGSPAIGQLRKSWSSPKHGNRDLANFSSWRSELFVAVPDWLSSGKLPRVDDETNRDYEASRCEAA